MAEMIDFFVEYRRNGIKKTEIVTAESHEKAISEIRKKYDGVTCCSAQTLELKKQLETREKERENMPGILANRIYSIDVYGFRDSETTPADIEESIKRDPIEVIKYLLDVIDNIQA